MIAKSDKIWMDGKLVDWDKASVHILTHTLHYGLGMFEGIRCYKTNSGCAIFRLDEHVDRLFASSHIFKIEIPYSKKEIRHAIIQTVKVNKLKECYIRPLVYIGYDAMGLYPKGNPVNVAIAAWPWGAYLGKEALEKGIRVKTSSFSRHHSNVTMCRAKAKRQGGQTLVSASSASLRCNIRPHFAKRLPCVITAGELTEFERRSMATFGLTLANRGVIIGAVTVPELFDMAKRGEDSGAFSAVWVGDSLLAKPRLESIALLSA